MNTNERQAIINYLEFSLVKYVEGIENHVTPDVTNLMYEKAFEVLRNIEDALIVQAEIDKPRAAPKSNS